MSGRDFLEPIVEAIPQSTLLPRIDGIRVGELVGIADNGTRPLVIYPGQPGTAAIPARSIPDLRGDHIGRQVVLMFDNADPACPIIMGCLQAENAWPLDDKPAQVEVDTDGERLVVSAKEEIVLGRGRSQYPPGIPMWNEGLQPRGCAFSRGRGGLWPLCRWAWQRRSPYLAASLRAPPSP